MKSPISDSELFESNYASLKKQSGFEAPEGFWDENAEMIMHKIDKPKSWIHFSTRILIRFGLPMAVVSIIWILLLPSVNHVSESFITEQVVLSYLDDDIMPGIDEDLIMEEFINYMPEDSIVKKKPISVIESMPSVQVPDSLQDIELTEEDILNYLLEEEFE